jgi:hypothetical protein
LKIDFVEESEMQVSICLMLVSILLLGCTAKDDLSTVPPELLQTGPVRPVPNPQLSRGPIKEMTANELDDWFSHLIRLGMLKRRDYDYEGIQAAHMVRITIGTDFVLQEYDMKNIAVFVCWYHYLKIDPKLNKLVFVSPWTNEVVGMDAAKPERGINWPHTMKDSLQVRGTSSASLSFSFKSSARKDLLII